MNSISGSGAPPSSEVEKKLEQALYLSRLVGKILSELIYLKGDQLRVERGSGSLEIAVLSRGTELKSMKVREIWLEPVFQWLYERAWPPELLTLHEAEKEDFVAVVRTGMEAVKLRVNRSVAGSSGGLRVELIGAKPLGDFISDLGVSGEALSAFLSLINQVAGVCLICGPTSVHAALGAKAFLCLSQAVAMPDTAIVSACRLPSRVLSSAMIVLESVIDDPFHLLMRERDAIISCGAASGIVCNAFVKRLCSACARSCIPPASDIENLPPGLRPPPHTAFMVGWGCERCGQTGMRNLSGLQSVLLLDSEAKARLKSKISDDVLLDYLYSSGTKPLFEDGLEKARHGKISLNALFDAVKHPPPDYRKYYEKGAAILASAPMPEASPPPMQAEIEETPEISISNDVVKPVVLVVEDDPDQRGILELVFKSAGYEVISSLDGRDGLAKLERHIPDLIITDLMMPNMDGREFVARLKLNKTWSKIPILVLTVLSDGDREYDLLELGADDYCEKTVQRKVLLKRVQNLLKRAGP